MKKTIIATAIILGITLSGMAQQGGGLMRRSQEYERARTSNNMRNATPFLPNEFGITNDVNSENGSPLGSGVAVLVGLGAAYAFTRKRKEE